MGFNPALGHDDGHGGERQEQRGKAYSGKSPGRIQRAANRRANRKRGEQRQSNPYHDLAGILTSGNSDTPTERAGYHETLHHTQ